MTKTQKITLRFAYDLLCGRFTDQPGIHITIDLDNFGASASQPGVWIEPDRDGKRTYLNEAVCAALVVRGYMECREFPPNKLWLYRITPEGCTAIGRVYPGMASTPQPLLKKFHRSRNTHHLIPNHPDKRDPHRFRRSSDWRRC